MTSSGAHVTVDRGAAHAPPRFGVLGTVRELIGFCARERVWLACMAAFVAIWTVELFTVQALTLVYPNETGARFAFWAPKIRLVLDLLFVLALTFWLPRRLLVPIAIGGFFVYLGLITYHQYFLRPLSLMTIVGNWREGIQVGGFAFDLFPKKAALALFLALAAQLAALYVSRKASLPRGCRWLGGTATVVAYTALFMVTLHFDPLDAIRTKRGVGRLGEIRGYLGPWFAEWYYLRGDHVLEQAEERRKVVYDRLTPGEAEIPIHQRLVILQAESLDYNILGHRANGQEVTPFLNRLRNMSMFYRVRAIHKNGSADADFAALNGVAGSDHTVTYKIPGYRYRDTTPQVLRQCGYATDGFHGNSGEFYERRRAFEKMGFAEVYFQEELEGRCGLNGGRWGVHDKDMLAFSAQKLRTTTTPTCHFVITLTTHTPYILLAPGEKEIFPHARTTAENYINNMRYLDNCLRDYVSALGQGTTLLVYADHPTEDGISDGNFEPDRSGAREFIPCFIYDTDRDLSKAQKTRNKPIATDGTLNLIDVVNYVRGQVMRQCDVRPTTSADDRQPAAEPDAGE